jgi:hypothetical protein
MNLLLCSPGTFMARRNSCSRHRRETLRPVFARRTYCTDHLGHARSDYIARAAIVADITAGRSTVGAASTYGLDTAA